MRAAGDDFADFDLFVVHHRAGVVEGDPLRPRNGRWILAGRFLAALCVSVASPGKDASLLGDGQRVPVARRDAADGSAHHVRQQRFDDGGTVHKGRWRGRRR